ncbi:grpIintron_endo, group I intron endonuclease [uncultured Caudovirales phage]|uniref:GrpIintron_endo, group I intron endonuclease n=1 Tax=uncultured Caudovirales phage TaxID=2100421 RepID=A0A6J7X9C1_9CAUD|nr:grpIintron_endo, group I intron endonuclease [uncultured Caudovirales phage]
MTVTATEIINFHNVNHTKSVVYCFEHIKSKKRYIGSTNNCKRRLQEHLQGLINNKHCNKYLQNYWNKWNYKNFIISVLENIPDENNNNKTYLRERENYWINFYKSFDTNNGFNLIKDALKGGRSGYKHTAESKAKMSAKSKLSYFKNPRRKDISKENIKRANTTESRRKALANRRSYEGISNPFWNKHHTEQTKEKLRNRECSKNLTGANNPNYGKKWNDTQRQKASLYNKQKNFYNGKIYNIKYINTDGTEEYHKIYNLRKYCDKKQLSYKNVSHLLPKKGKYLNLVYIDKCSAKLDKKYSDIVYEVCNFSDELLERREAEAKLVETCM